MGGSRTLPSILLLVSGCASVHHVGDGAAPDAGTDTWAADAGIDAPAHAGVDAFDPPDTAPRDAFDPPDGSAWDPEWRQVVDAPVDCHVEIATHPERLSWPFGYVYRTHDIDGRTYFDVDPGTDGPRERWTRYRGLADTSGGVVTAFRWYADTTTGGDCWIDDVDVYGTDVGFLVGYCGIGSTCGIWGNWVTCVYRGRYDDLATSQQKIGQYDLSLISDEPPAQAIALGASHTSVEDLQLSVRVVRPDGTVPPIGFATWGTFPWLRPVVHLGSDMLFVGMAAPPHLMRSIDGAMATELRDASGRPIEWLGTDGTTVAWSVDGELWAGTYDGDLVGTLVRTMASPAGSAVGGGMVARFETSTGSPAHRVLVLDRVADRHRASVDLPESRVGSGPPRIVRITEREILLATSSGYEVLAEIRRIDPSTLTFR